ncbi:hypothetical protein C7451_10491 [Blastomonas natatoria]|uniref:Uncharacterized protein n=1 Tax=Blastomonas natatoria TaxID=34015 RepID=A0A2V3V750_9SPHN|nr:hypothetical protein [Blastomonas natatoria]PXW77596.1 hypothetical protein C7451_10491 [Blastomonas natatoria]
MLNILSIIIGLVALVLAIPAFLPLLGALNWLIVPIALVGVLLGFLSSSNSGRNLCLIVLAVCIIRLSLGGGIL